MSHHKVNIGVYLSKAAILVISSLVLGFIIDKLIRRLQIKLGLKPLTVVIIQITVIILVIYVSQKFISKFYNNGWETSIPSFFFVVFFFGTQTCLRNNLLAVGNSVYDENK